jgi:D-alanyl-D-alanine carboxypeptidase (penicillin-binding protein 5/6)
MTYRQIFRTILTLITLSGLLGTTWIAFSWFSSRPVARAAVLGVSTEATASTPTPLLPYPIKTGKSDPAINARQYVLYNADSGKVLVQSDSLDAVPIASTTKLMTTYITSKLANPDDQVTISQEGGSQVGSLMNLSVGETVSVRNLLYGTLLVSGNDAAFSLGEYIGGKLLHNPNASTDEKIKRFVEEMNTTAKSINMTSTQYKDPAGLNDDGHSNALDLAKLTTLVIQQKELRTVIGTAQTVVTDVTGQDKFDLRNSNRLTADYNYQGNIGGKTGNTPAAGHCLVTSAERNGITLIAVILSTYSEANEASALEARKLLDYGFANFSWQ